ncbi:luxQ, partial [Symbiodinium sp. KB8]
DCGEQYRGFPQECPRCGGQCPVSNPLQVTSWLDEVKEKEAFDQMVGAPMTRDEFVPPEYRFEKPDELDYYQTPADALVSTPTTTEPAMHRLDVLRRHGRGGHLRHGWDGSPSEVQPFVFSDAFLTAAHLSGADQPEVPEVTVERTFFTTTSPAPSLSEQLAKVLLRQRDFEHESCHQLLQVVQLRKPSRQCLSADRPGAGSLTLGYFSHGRQLGFTKDTIYHKHLARYLGRYLRFHGMIGDISSIFISNNVHSMYHTDRHNSRGSLNWQISFGQYVGGDLWVEREDYDFKYHLMERRKVLGQYRYGYVLDTRRKLQSFRPDRRHGSDDFHGDRLVVTAYQTRLVDKAPDEDLEELKKLGFRSKRSTAGPAVLTATESVHDVQGSEPHYVPVTEAYPVKEQSAVAKDSERLIALESSSEEEGHDGTFETRRAELQARKKEIHWRSLTEEEKPAFVEAVQKEWAEWLRWSSCKEVRVKPDEVPAHLPYQYGAARRCSTDYLRRSTDKVTRWFDHFAKVLRNLGWHQHSLDPCLFLWKEDTVVTAVLGLHVDDLVAAALPGAEETLNQVEASFTWGTPWVCEDFTFIGRRVRQHPDGSVTVDQASYVSEVPTTKVKLPEDTLLSLHPELVTEFRSGIGSLQWLSSTTRGDVAADVSLIQRPPKELTVADLREVNSVLRYVKATSEAMFRIVHVSLDSFVFVAYGDSGFANAPNNKSQGGLVVVATDRRALQEPWDASLLEWKSYRHQRVLRSTLAAEASALDRSYDHARFMAMVFSEMVYGDYIATLNERAKFEVVPVTDARSLWDAVHRLSTSFTEKRVEIDVAALRQSCQGLRWVPTEQMHADSMTKRSRSLRDSFRQWMAQPRVTLVDSKSLKDVAEGTAANEGRSDTLLVLKLVLQLEGGAKSVTAIGQDLGEVGQKAVEDKKKALNAIVTQEVRTPLHGMVGLATVMEKTAATAGAKKQLGMMRASASRLLDVVTNALELSEGEQRKLLSEPSASSQKVSFAAVAEEVVTMARLAVDKANKPLLKPGVEIKNLMAEQEQIPLVLGNTSRCTQLLYNLVMNACKFTAAGSVSLSCTHLADASELEIRVVDTGVGLPPEALEKIFLPFEQDCCWVYFWGFGFLARWI